MADSPPPKPATDEQYQIAVRVLKLSIIALSIVGGILIIASMLQSWYSDDAHSLIENTKLVWGALLPMLGTWVGTVLAFYFSRDNFKTATESVRDLLTSDQKLKELQVDEKMIDLNNVVRLNVPKLDTVKLVEQVRAEMDKGDKNRLPILDANDHPLCLMHRSTVDGFLLKQTLAGKSVDDLKKLTMKNLLDGIGMKAADTFVVVPKDASLHDAKRAMESKKGCSDVFVTANGKSDEPVVGWLTNVIIGEAAKV